MLGRMLVSVAHETCRTLLDVPTDVEGGSDSWDRPPLPMINPKKDTISKGVPVTRRSVD